jgi:glucokinase
MERPSDGTNAMTLTIGLDVGGTKILGVVRAADGSILDEHRAESSYDREGVLGGMAAVVTRLQRRDVVALGIGIAGLVTPDGRLRYGPNLPGVEEVDIRGEMAARTGLTTSVDNDANVAGYAEVVQGAARGCRHALVVTLGTGIGGALIVDGEIFRGANGFAGEIGHWSVERGGAICACGERGHWEAIASGSALGRLGREAVAAGRLVAADPVDGHTIGALAARGDGAAIAVLAEYADNVAIGLAGLATILDPEVIVISGGVVELGALLFEPLRRAFVQYLEGDTHRPEIPLLPAVLGERAGAIGAAAMVSTLLAR